MATTTESPPTPQTWRPAQAGGRAVAACLLPLAAAGGLLAGLVGTALSLAGVAVIM
jgi:hypothetical protein